MIHINNKKNLPQLRIVTTSLCNGRCFYCHKEGSISDGIMDFHLIQEIIHAANDVGIPNICITGGEPSTRKDLHDIINYMDETYYGDITLTSNGFNLLKITDKIKNRIYRLNLSMTSFNKRIASKYQNVRPEKILPIILNFPSQYKNINFIAVEDNYKEIPYIVEFCANYKISLDIIFELKKFTLLDLIEQFSILRSINLDIDPIVNNNYFKKITLYNEELYNVNIKHPLINSHFNNKICNKCSNGCFEKMCSIRVYHDKRVSPCINNNLFFKKTNLKESILEACIVYNDNIS